MSVNMHTGASNVSVLGRFFPVKGAKCGLWGCGFLTIGDFNTESQKLTGWVEALVRNPPSPPPEKIKKPTQNVGMTFIEFNTKTGEAEATRSFGLNPDTDPSMNAGGTSCYDDDGNMWFPCSPAKEFNTQAVCRVSSSPSNTPAIASVMKWSNKNMSVTAIQYSKALKSVVVLAQGLVTGNSTVVKTALYTVSSKMQIEDWPVLVDLGTAAATLHQTTISPDGKYLVAVLSDGSTKEMPYPNARLVTVDILAKKVVNTIVALGKDFTMLAAMPCPAGEAAEQTLVI
eukprot:gnl/TRDRNA2_/TRDRNA2_55903_c0_seq1.p1 gnl/TRDRNA2_/TRDRNA2_55903_c0~~gnl/TRDRNA2_/TRDRNA2_55903_c0_seq1.p1  ORF type:complete len:330 (-),score=57.62 gnl/TRDRNA2_/TRDRNA2_55903_c0_seq1:100-957(-)